MLHPRLSRARPVRAPGRLLVPAQRPARRSSARATTRSRARRTSSSRSSPASRTAPARAIDVVTNLDVDAQRTRVCGARPGARARSWRIEPRTGQGARDGVRARLRPEPACREDIGALNQDPNKPVLNRTTQEAYPPGSTFKVVTATAALDTGAVTPDTVIDGSSPLEVSGVPLENFGGTDFGPITVTDALTNSVNTVFAQIGEQVGTLHARGVHEALRLLRGPEARLPGRRDDRERRSGRPTATWSRTASTSAASRSARAGRRARSGPRRCRWPRWPPPSPTAGGS